MSARRVKRTSRLCPGKQLDQVVLAADRGLLGVLSPGWYSFDARHSSAFASSAERGSKRRNCLSRLSAHLAIKSQADADGKSAHTLGLERSRTTAARGVDKGRDEIAAHPEPGAESLLTVALYPADRRGTVFAYLDHW